MRVKNYTVSHPCIYIKKKSPGLSRVYPGSGLTRRVDRVSPGQLPRGFLLRPGPVPGPGRPGRPAGPVRVLKLWKKPISLIKISFLYSCIF